MINQCCCGRLKPAPEEPTRINDTIHEPFGKTGAFCGPADKHTIRDQQAEIEKLRAALDEMPEVDLEFAKKEDWCAWNVWKEKHAAAIRGEDTTNE